jgi:hypothetical protein
VTLARVMAESNRVFCVSVMQGEMKDRRKAPSAGAKGNEVMWLSLRWKL